MSLTRQTRRLVDRALIAGLVVGVPGWLFGYWYCSGPVGLNGYEAAGVATGLVVLSGLVLIPTSFDVAARCRDKGRRAVLQESEVWRLIRVGLFAIAPVEAAWMLVIWNDPLRVGTLSGPTIPMAFGAGAVWVWIGVSFLIAHTRVSRPMTSRLERQVTTWDLN
jgi:hypothetical protein